MRKAPFYLALISIVLVAYISCKKSDNKNTTTTETFADSLKQSCTKPFVGVGDSADFYLATAFTPNGDGIDDFYGLIGAKLHFSSFLMTIYDTTGTLVYQTSDPGIEWDGTDTTTGKQSAKYKFYVEVKYTTPGNKTGSAGTYLFLLSTNDTLHCVNMVKSDSASYEFADQFDPATGAVVYPSNEPFCN